MTVHYQQAENRTADEIQTVLETQIIVLVVVLVLDPPFFSDHEYDDEDEKDMDRLLSSCQLLQVLGIPSSLNFDF